MSKQRQKDRAAREARAAAARPKGPVAKAPAPKPAARAAAKRTSKRPLVYRQRRFPPLPLWLKAVLAAVWLTCLVLVLALVPTVQGRLGFMVIATMLLPLIVVLVRDPTRRTRR